MRFESTTNRCQQAGPALAETLEDFNAFLAVTYSRRLDYTARVNLDTPLKPNLNDVQKVLPVIDCAGYLDGTERLEVTGKKCWVCMHSTRVPQQMI